jgi:hypothetical protein
VVVNFATNCLNIYYVVSRYFQKGSYLSVKHELYTFRIDKLAFPTITCSSRIFSLEFQSGKFWNSQTSWGVLESP